MKSKKTNSGSTFVADQLYLGLVGQGTFYGLLAALRGQLFRDADVASCIVRTVTLTVTDHHE